LYHEVQTLISDEGPIEQNIPLRLALLKESAELGHSGAALADGLQLEEGKICVRDAEEAGRFFGLSAMLSQHQGDTLLGSTSTATV
jgi:TPR repeat protein